MGTGMEGSGRSRWNSMRNKAGIPSDRALERALGVSTGQIWNWIVRGRDPSLYVCRQLKQLFGVSLDVLDETIVSWRTEESCRRRGVIEPED